MGKAVPVTLDNVIYPTKGKAEEHVRTILYSYSIDAFHPEAEEKIGSGVLSFFVGEPGDEEHGGQCFWIRRADGTADDFSFKKCIQSIK